MVTASRKLNALAVEAAVALGHHWVGSEHFVLAILHPDAESSAKKSLQALGIDYTTFAERLTSLPSSYAERPGMAESKFGDGRFVDSEGISLLSRAEGIAFGMGCASLQPEHILLSLLWAAVPQVSHQVLETLGADREHLLEELKRRDVAVPSTPMPLWRRWSTFRVVSAEEYEQTRAQALRSGAAYRVAYRDGETLMSVEEEG